MSLYGNLVIICCLFSLNAFATQEPSYTSLSNDPSSGYVKHFRQLFEKVDIHSLVEFGLGNGTQYFLDHCDKVTSCEILLPHQSDGWFKAYQAYAMTNRWTHIQKVGSVYLEKADRLAQDEKTDPSLQDATYILELKDLCDELFTRNSFDIAFINPRIHLRGDLVNELFQRVPIIVAHDTSYGKREYGWYKVQTPSNYQKIVYKDGYGTTFWVHRDKQDVIFALQGYIQEPEHQKLRIFFPDVHPALSRSMALALNHLGHTMVVPDESFMTQSASRGPKIHFNECFKRIPKNNSHPIEIISNIDILKNPPDVIFINGLEVEEDLLNLWKKLNASGKSIKLAHYSGNSDTAFNPHYVKNLIAVDAFTASRFEETAPNIIFWIPWIDFHNLTFNGPSDDLALNSFLSLHYSVGFLQGKALYEMIADAAQRDFPSMPLRAPKPLSQEQMYALMDKSWATLHFKEHEGFGYTIIESLAKGKPVFLKRSFSQGKRLMNWCIEGKTAFFFDDYNEFRSKVQFYLDNNAARRDLQKKCSEIIRSIINNENQLLVLDNFLKNLLPQPSEL